MTKPIKILLMDLENVQLPQYMFHRGSQSKFNSRPAGFCADLAYILVFGYKWLGEPAQSIQLTKQEFKLNHLSDDAILLKAKEIMDEADVIVTWYGKGHDLPFLASRLLRHGLYLDHKKPHIDLHQVAKKTLRLSSYSMDSVAKFLGLPKKSSISPAVWAACWAGKYEALEEMASYCRQDCTVLENIYHKLIGLGTGIPHVGKHLGLGSLESCPSCGSQKITGKGRRVTKLKTYKRLICIDCGTSFKGEEIK